MRLTYKWAPLVLAMSPFLLALREEPKPAYAAELGEAIPGLSEEGEAAFARGRRLFRWKLWAPSRGTEGINSTECTECHIEPTFGGSTKDKELFVAMLPDAQDPSGFLMYPRIALVPGQRSLRREPPPDAELRRPPALFGIGLLEAVSDDTLQKLADPEDKNKDGISGRSIMVEGGMGRFGWKAASPTLDRFVITAFKNELGILPEPIDQPDFTRLGPNQLRVITQYLRLLGAPKPDALKGEALVGKAHFEKLGCVSCHVPVLETGERAIPQLRGKKAEAFTDLLLHDMGPGPALPETGPRANSREFRTPPLWGLGKVGAPYLHNGSAETVHDAILKHEGEAMAARDLYLKLSTKDQKAVQAFLNSL